MTKRTDLPPQFTERLNFTSLTESEKEAIRARAVEQVLKEKRAAQDEAFFQKALDEARLEHDETLPATRRAKLIMEDVFVDLPGHAIRILLDGEEFLHGFIYKRNQLVCQTIREIMQRAWDHENEVGGANRKFYDRPRNVKLTRHSQRMTNTQILGV